MIRDYKITERFLREFGHSLSSVNRANKADSVIRRLWAEPVLEEVSEKLAKNISKSAPKTGECGQLLDVLV